MNRTQFAIIALWTGIVLIAFAVLAWVYDTDRFLVGWLGTLGALSIAGTVFERVRYKEVSPAPPLGPGWAATNERFRDPATGKWVQVYFKQETGERSYVETTPPTN